jgi:Holliday junction resolvase RusA-like endonuclease
MIRHFVKIDGQPIGKGRPRFSRAGHAYTPQPTRSWEEHAAWIFRAAIGGKQYNQPLRLNVTAYFKRPQRLMRKKSPANRVHHTAKPDADNVLKIVCDALVKAGVVKDDALINQQVCTKYYAAKNAPPEVVVMLDSWEDGEGTI